MLRNVVGALLVVAYLFSANTATAGLSGPGLLAATKCAAAKRRAAGRKELDRLACAARQVGNGSPGPFCLAKAEARFERSFGRANVKGPCPGDTATIEALVDQCVTSLENEISGDSKCSAFKLKIAGKVASMYLSCWGRELLRPNTVMLCLSEAFSRLTSAFSKAGSCDGSLGAVQAIIDSVCAQPVGAALPVYTTTSTTTTTSTSTTSTTGMVGCCGPTQIVATSGPGTLTVGTFAAFPFPAGVRAVVNAGPADANCRHDAVVPVNGFSVPPFCVASLNATSTIIATGCVSGGTIGKGSIWDGGSTCGAVQASISKTGDTSDGVCNPAGQLCTTALGGSGDNTLGNVDTVRSGPCVGGGGVHVGLDVPSRSVTWLSPGGCPDPDGQYDPGTDTLLSDFSFILSPTTDTATARFADQNADGCSFVGAGPSGPVTLTGTPAPGPCCVIGQQTTLVSVGTAFTGGPTLNDLIFQSFIPTTVSECNAWPGTTTCVLTNDPCMGSASGAFLD
jgi:hypothetical protein